MAKKQISESFAENGGEEGYFTGSAANAIATSADRMKNFMLAVLVFQLVVRMLGTESSMSSSSPVFDLNMVEFSQRR